MKFRYGSINERQVFADPLDMTFINIATRNPERMSLKHSGEPSTSATKIEDVFIFRKWFRRGFR